jgi:hypothetical protein
MEVEGHLYKLRAQEQEENKHRNRRRHVGPPGGPISDQSTQHSDGEVFLLDEEGGKAGGNNDRKQQLTEISKSAHARQIKMPCRAVIKGEQGDHDQTSEAN